jgi:hypothetical protein
MSLSFGSKSTDTKQSGTSSSERDPWDKTVPYLSGFLKNVGKVGGTGLTTDQKAAFDYLKGNAFEGNPWDVQQATLANDLYGTADRTGIVGDAYGKLHSQLGDYASGKFLDPMSNPQMQAMLTQVGDDAQNRINAMFAGAGRDLSGANQQAVAKGVTQAQLPLLIDQFNRAQDQQMGAAQTLFGAGQNTASAQAQLDAQRAALRGQGAQAGQTALDQQNAGANQVLALDQQLKMLPYEDLGTLGSLLFPVAQLGGQSKGKTQSKGSMDQLSFGAEANVGKALGTILSDERAKEGIEEIGEMADGTPMYRYRYKDDPTGTIHVGPMAQEVEQRTPSAVDDDGPSGLKMVNMDAATRKAADIIRKRMAAKRKGD